MSVSALIQLCYPCNNQRRPIWTAFVTKLEDLFTAMISSSKVTSVRLCMLCPQAVRTYLHATYRSCASLSQRQKLNKHVYLRGINAQDAALSPRQAAAIRLR